MTSSLFLTVTLMLLAFPALENRTLRDVEKVLPLSRKGASFHVLIRSDVNVARVGRKLRSLQGVFQVVPLAESQIQKKVQKTLSQLGSEELVKEALNLGYNGLKIIFNKQVDMRVQSLVRDYLSKLVGKDNIIMGETLARQKSDRLIDRILVSMKRWGGLGIYGVLAILWLTLFILWAKGFRQEAILLQRFQRRKNIALKSYTLMMALFAFAAIILSILLNPKADMTLLFVSVILFSMSSLAFLPKRSNLLSRH